MCPPIWQAPLPTATTAAPLLYAAAAAGIGAGDPAAHGLSAMLAAAGDRAPLQWQGHVDVMK